MRVDLGGGGSTASQKWIYVSIPRVSTSTASLLHHLRKSDLYEIHQFLPKHLLWRQKWIQEQPLPAHSGQSFSGMPIAFSFLEIGFVIVIGEWLREEGAQEGKDSIFRRFHSCELGTAECAVTLP